MKALVTGGGGFLGRAIVERLVARGEAVRTLSRQTYPFLETLGVEQHAGDLADMQAVARAVEGCGIVYHVAAKAGVWGPWRDYYRTNVVGTANIVEACKVQGVPRLVFTSSPSVVYDGRDQAGVDESAPYPRRHLAAYPATKAESERLVREAAGATLGTVALRPHLIWGPGDPHLIPRIIERARRGRLRRIGKRPCLVDTIYIDNAADAHLLAADRLTPGSPISGQVYFLSQGEPVPLWDFINRVLATVDLPPVTRSISAKTAFYLGAGLEAVYRLFHLPGEPPMTRFVARQLSTAHWFNSDAARRDLGYAPRVSLDEGLRRLGESLRQTERAR